MPCLVWEESWLDCVGSQSLVSSGTELHGPDPHPSSPSGHTLGRHSCLQPAEREKKKNHINNKTKTLKGAQRSSEKETWWEKPYLELVNICRSIGQGRVCPCHVDHLCNNKYSYKKFYWFSRNIKLLYNILT